MFKITSLQKFLISSNKAGYASGKEKAWTKEKDFSTTISYQEGDFKMHDNFFGGEPYGGRMVVFYKNKPVWMMVYYGWVEKIVKDPNIVYGILRSALKQMPNSAPFRGPKIFKDKELVYENKWNGEIERFSGEEKISKAGKQLYFAQYAGGLVDQRTGV